MVHQPFLVPVAYRLLSSLTATLVITPIPAAYSFASIPFFSEPSSAVETKDNHEGQHQGSQVSGGARWGEKHPGRQTSGGARNDCPDVETPLTALIPDTHWGRSTARLPTVWFYVPYSVAQISHGAFIVQDDQGIDLIEPITFTLADTPGLVSITFPESLATLDMETDYLWSFQLYCNPTDRTPLFVEGWIQLDSLTADMVDQFETNASYQVFWENGIWFDAVHELMQQRLSHPSDPDLNLDWLQLLEEGGLVPEIFSTTPIVGSIQLDP